MTVPPPNPPSPTVPSPTGAGLVPPVVSAAAAIGATPAPAAPAPSRFARHRWRLALLALVAAGAAAGVALRMRPPEIPVATLAQAPLVRTLQFTARVEVPQRVELGATVTGRVARVAVREGDRVQAGDVLVQLETEEPRATLAQAEAALAQARAQAAAQQSVARPTADAQVAQADATLRAAERDLARNRDLVARGFVSQARVDDARRAVEVARAQRDGAQAAARAQTNAGAESARARAQVEAAQAAVAAARSRLTQTAILAPSPGRVLVRNVEPGQIVQPGRGFLTLGVDGPTELVAAVDERFLSQLQVDQPARVVADAFPQQPFAARVFRVAPSVDAQRGTVTVRLRIPDDARPAFLREDMTLSVEVETGRRAQALVLPLRALRAAPVGDRAQVLVAQQGHAQLREVRLGLRTLDQAEVLQGLQAGERIVLDGSVAPGSRLRAREATAAEGAAARPEALPMNAFGR